MEIESAWESERRIAPIFFVRMYPQKLPLFSANRCKPSSNLHSSVHYGVKNEPGFFRNGTLVSITGCKEKKSPQSFVKMVRDFPFEY